MLRISQVLPTFQLVDGLWLVRQKVRAFATHHPQHFANVVKHVAVKDRLRQSYVSEMARTVNLGPHAGLA